MTIAVIGAGIAGIGAARALADAGKTVVVFEARDRIGGRIYTRRDIAGDLPVEMGAEFLHGDKVPQWAIVDALGLRTFHWKKQEESLVRMETGELVTMTEARTNPDFDITRSWALPDVPVVHDDEDLYHYLTRLGFKRDQLQYTRRSLVNAIGEPIHHISARATVAELQDTTAGDGDYRVLDGYDKIVMHLADGLDVRLSTPVTAVDWSAERESITITTGDGAFHAFDQIVVAVPLGVLQKGRIAFEPSLPAERRSAMSGLEMGAGMKIVYVFDRPVLPAGIGALYSAENPPMWWSPSYGQPDNGKQVITAFATGDWARDLYRLGKDGMIRRGLRTLRSELGADNVPEPEAVHVQSWTDDPYTLGVYSVVKPGGYECRDILARPLNRKLFWAGEAVAPNKWASTVHGALATGRRAAQEILSL